MTPVPSNQHLSSGSLALLVHGVFFAALVYGLSWKSLPQLPVEADLWRELPAISLPPPPPEPPPVRPEPTVKPAPPLPSKADIALEKKKNKQQAEEMAKQLKLAEERKLEAKRQLEQQAKADQARQEQQRIEKLKLEQAQLEKDRLLKAQQEKERLEKTQREAKRRQFEQELAKVMHDSMTAESSQLKAAHDHVQAMQQAKLVMDFRERIMVKVRSNVRLPQNLSGNPEAEFLVKLLPNGEVQRAILIKSSGQALYDQEVERAILKSSPLPLPSDRGAAAAFRDELSLKFRPLD